jgi:hypothetical protein
MPNTSYDPNYGVRDESTAGELAAERMRDFLFRQRLADQQASAQDRELTSRERMNSDNLATQAALQGQSLDAQRDINGSFNDRSAAETALTNLKESGLTGRARIANEPQMGALGLQRDQMAHQWNKEDNTPDAMINRALAAAIAKQTGASMPSAPGSAAPGAMPAPMPGTPSRSYDTDRDGGGPMDNDHDGDRAPAPSQRLAGPGQYQFDDKSARTMSSMLDQLKGSVPPERFDQAVAMLDNSRKQRSQRDLDAMDAKAAAAKASAASPAMAPAAGAPGAPISLKDLVKLQTQLKTGINPDAAEAAHARAIEDQNRQAMLALAKTAIDSGDTVFGNALLQKIGALPAGISIPTNPVAAITKASQQSQGIQEALDKMPEVNDFSTKVLSSFDAGANPEEVKQFFDKSVNYIAQKSGASPDAVRGIMLQKMGPKLNNIWGANMSQFLSYPISSVANSMFGERVPGAKTRADILNGN